MESSPLIGGIIDRAPPSSGFFDGFLQGYQLVSFSDGGGTVLLLFYSTTGPSNGYILAIDMAFGNLGPATMSQNQYSSFAVSILGSLGVPINTLSKTSYFNQTNYTTLVFSSEFSGYSIAGCNLAAFTFANATNQLVEIQLRPFLTLPAQLLVTPDQAILAGRASAHSKYLDPADEVMDERLIGIRFVPWIFDEKSSRAESDNSTASASMEIRFGYECLVSLASARYGVNYSILAVLDVESGETLIVVREPVPVELIVVALPFWAVAGVVIATLVILVGLVAVSPEFAISLIGSAIAPLYMRLRGAGVLDSFNRGRLYGYISAKPGATFTELKNNFTIGNGNLAYHLSVLERLELVRSVKDGRTRRFFCQGVSIESAGIQCLGRTEARVFDELNRRGPSSNSDLARELGMSRQRTHYNLKLLRGRGLIDVIGAKWRAKSTVEKAPPSGD
jgi:predicted transcriptional regulator